MVDYFCQCQNEDGDCVWTNQSCPYSISDIESDIKLQWYYGDYHLMRLPVLTIKGDNDFIPTKNLIDYLVMEEKKKQYWNFMEVG